MRNALIGLIVVHLGMLWAAVPSWGVIINSDDGSGNTIAPADDFGFAHVARRSSSTAIYLGHRWMLTAAHLNPGSVEIQGRFHFLTPGSSIQLANPAGLGLDEFTDLRMFRLQSDPGLQPLVIGRSAPPVGAEVILAGRGKDREADRTGWQVTDAKPRDIWTETTPPGTPGDKNGYHWLESNSFRWGTNVIEDDGDPNDSDHSTVIDSGFAETISLVTDFDDVTGSEAHAALDDSGGGIFFKNDGQWELVGIIHSIGIEEGQPGGTAVFGNETYAADLSVYRDQIESIIQRSLPDLNGDMTIDAADAGVLFANWGTSGAGDINNDQIVDGGDAGIMFSVWSVEVTTIARAESASGVSPAHAGRFLIPEPVSMVALSSPLCLLWFIRSVARSRRERGPR